jgi:hypothetical protein
MCGMGDPSDFDSFSERFVGMPVTRRQSFLLLYSFELTILMRGYFADAEYEKAQSRNELLHRVLGFLASMNAKTESDWKSFAELLWASAQQKGLVRILCRSLSQSEK